MMKIPKPLVARLSLDGLEVHNAFKMQGIREGEVNVAIAMRHRPDRLVWGKGDSLETAVDEAFAREPILRGGRPGLAGALARCEHAVKDLAWSAANPGDIPF